MSSSEPVSIADVMRAYGANAVVYAKSRYAMDLNYSEASMMDVDRMLADRMQGRVIDPNALSPQEQEELWEYCKMIGAYVGEVIIRNLGGAWETKEFESGGLAVKLMAAGKVEGSPPDSVWRMLTEPYRGAASYYRSLKAVLGLTGRSVEPGVQVITPMPLSSDPPKA